jgi:hypothetical protein
MIIAPPTPRRVLQAPWRSPCPLLEGDADTVHAHVEEANEILISHQRLRQGGVHAQHAFVKKPKTTIIGKTTNKPRE